MALSPATGRPLHPWPRRPCHQPPSRSGGAAGSAQAARPMDRYVTDTHGSKTASAVKGYQTKRGLPVTLVRLTSGPWTGSPPDQTHQQRAEQRQTCSGRGAYHRRARPALPSSATRSAPRRPPGRWPGWSTASPLCNWTPASVARSCRPAKAPTTSTGSRSTTTDEVRRADALRAVLPRRRSVHRLRVRLDRLFGCGSARVRQHRDKTKMAWLFEK